ncbi:MAG: PleD family two-component system response regulator [Beijerinckiaceae bacterium]
MTARVLVVDDILPNVKLLEARLSAEYFDVLTAMSGPEALAICGEGKCDIVLLDVMMPGMDGFEVCRRLKSDVATAHIPVVMVTALDQPADRVRGLDAGADDFLTKPVDEVALIARVRSLSRLKVSLDELRSRALTAASLGVPNKLAEVIGDDGFNGRILLVDDRPNSAERLQSALTAHHQVDVEAGPQEALFRAVEGDYDLVLVSLGLKDYDGLRLCSQLRSVERTRQTPILMIADLEDRQRVLRGLDLGVNDYLSRPVDRNELVARVRTQLRRRRYAAALRDNVQASIELALTDALTGLHNRRYLENHLAAMLDHSVKNGRNLVMAILDIDHFKMVNDSYGHDAGDEVLKGFAERVKRVVRGADLMCRLGGEEFVVVMPETNLALAQTIAERIRGSVQAEPFTIDGGARAIPVTVSIGLAQTTPDADPDALFRRADRALYRSKNEGRNRVTADAA